MARRPTPCAGPAAGLSRNGRVRPRSGHTAAAVLPRRHRVATEALEGRWLLAFAPAGPEFPVNQTAAANQSNPAAAADADGDFVIAWQSYGQDGAPADYGVYAKRYTAAGVELAPPAGVVRGVGNEFRVNAATAGDQKAPSVAIDVALRLDGDAGTGGVADADGGTPDLLDGDWADPTHVAGSNPPAFTGGRAYPSGDGTAGGDFSFSLRVLPGDFNRNGSVNLSDFGVLRANFGTGGVVRSVLQGDATGDGNTNLADLGVLRANFGKTTPL